MREKNNNQDIIWSTYIKSHIRDLKTIWSGPSADILPVNTPIYVITGHNPFGKLLSYEENNRRNINLLNELNNYDVEINQVTGMSPTGDWQEESFAVYGINRQQACKIASLFEQRAIFEIRENELLVVEVNTQEIKSRRARNIVN